MAFSRALMLLSLVALAQAAAGGLRSGSAQAPPSPAAAASPSPAPPVEARKVESPMTKKVLTMLETLKEKILAEGEKEAKSYDTFACFCKDTTQETSEAIQKNMDEKEALSASIAEHSTLRKELDEEIQEEQTKIENLEKSMKEAKAKREEEKKEYEKNAADLAAAIAGLDAATKSIKGSKAAPSFAQLGEATDAVRAAALAGGAKGVGSDDAERLLALLQQPEVEMEDYKFHSEDIIATLEKLTTDFTAGKTSLDEEEVHAVAEHKMFSQDNEIKTVRANKKMAKAQKEKSGAQEEIASLSERLTITTGELMDNQAYLSSLSAMCADKAKTWDQRSTARANELQAMTSAIGILEASVAGRTAAGLIQKAMGARAAESIAGSEEAMEALEVEAEDTDAPVSFLQRLQKVTAHGQGDADGRAAVAALLLAQGSKLHSAVLTSLANKIKADPFAKVKFLIQELIERLLQEANEEGNQKAWCGKATSEAETKRDASSEAVTELNGKMARLESVTGKLGEELHVLSSEVAELKANQKKTTAMREADQQENSLTVSEAKEGIEALGMARDVISKFYKTAAQGAVDLSPVGQAPSPAPAFLQQPSGVAFQAPSPAPAFLQQPSGVAFQDAPDAGFDNGEAYTGAQSASGGIVGMLDVIESDFERAVTDAEEAEAKQAKEYMDFMTETGVSLAEKEVVVKALTSQNDAAMEDLANAKEQLASQSEVLEGAIKELLELKPVCIDTAMSYEDRVALRKEEMDALTKAMCILENYAKYGPDGAAGAC